ncbi:hypothetical protein BJX65DRAFT_282142 [Aspergillus insuetus]
MRSWQAARRAHCVIDHLSLPASPSSLKPPTSLQATLLRPFSSTPHSHHHNSSARIQNAPTKPKTFHTTPQRTPVRTTPSTQPPPTALITTRSMSSDDAYMSFLDKANADLNSGRSQPETQSSSAAARTETIDVNVKVPTPLTSVDAYYISDTDEPFEPVALKWEGAAKGNWPDAAHFSKLISTNTDLSSSIETLSASSFDPKNQYSSVLRAVRAAAVQSSGGDESAVEVKVYRVETGTSRVEYYVTALDAEGNLLVGLRAKAIES